jgi:hypothetical protein
MTYSNKVVTNSCFRKNKATIIFSSVQCSLEKLELNKFIVTDQMNSGWVLGNLQSLYSVQYANLKLEAAEATTSVSNFTSALCYARHSLVYLVDHQCQWQEPNYKLTLRLYDAASKARSTSAQNGKLRYFLDNIFENVLYLEDKLPSILLLFETPGAMDRNDEAIKYAFDILEELGDTFQRVFHLP